MPITRDAHYWDHLRDERKHEPRPSDIPLRLQPKPLSTAMDVAILVRALDNIEQAAALIETFVDAKASEQRLDAVAAGARP
jgi:hypothetical protein